MVATTEAATTTTTAVTTTDATTATAAATQPQKESISPELLERIQKAQKIASEVPEEFSWFADFDLSKGYAFNCGINKCFYPSRTDEKLGYLVANTSQYRQMKNAHKLEEDLVEEFGIIPLSKSIERIDGITPEMAYVLSKYTRQWGYQKQHLTFRLETQNIVLQRVHKVPSPSLTCAFTPRKGGSMLQRMPEFIKQIPDPAAFAKQFLIEQDRTYKIMKAYSQLLDDFQFILDTSGHLYHIDLDRNGRGERETIRDKDDLEHKLHKKDRDMTWLLQQLTPSLLGDDDPRQKCQHSFCAEKKSPEKELKRKKRHKS